MSSLSKREVNALRDLAKASRRINSSVATTLLQRQLVQQTGNTTKNGVLCTITTHGRRALKDL